MNKQQRIDELERTLKIEQNGVERLQAENSSLKTKIGLIAGENESLRMDKKWLQQMHSAVLQSMHSFVSGKRPC